MRFIRAIIDTALWFAALAIFVVVALPVLLFVLGTEVLRHYAIRWLPAAVILVGCAHTDIYSHGQRVAHFEGDMSGTKLTVSITGELTFEAAIVNHSVATRAMGSAVAKNIQSAGTAAGAIGAAIATSGLKP